MSTPDLTLAKVIAKFKQIADEDFDGKIYENVMSIFNELSVKERALLLRGLINFCFIVEDEIVKNTCALTMVKVSEDEKRNAIDSEISDLEAHDSAEALKLKYWLIKFAFAILTIAGFGALIAIALVNPIKITDLFKDLFTVVKLIF